MAPPHQGGTPPPPGVRRWDWAVESRLSVSASVSVSVSVPGFLLCAEFEGGILTFRRPGKTRGGSIHSLQCGLVQPPYLPPSPAKRGENLYLTPGWVVLDETINRWVDQMIVWFEPRRLYFCFCPPPHLEPLLKDRTQTSDANRIVCLFDAGNRVYGMYL